MWLIQLWSAAIIQNEWLQIAWVLQNRSSDRVLIPRNARNCHRSWTYIVMTYIVMTYIAMTYIVMARIVMTYMVKNHLAIGPSASRTDAS